MTLQYEDCRFSVTVHLTRIFFLHFVIKIADEFTRTKGYLQCCIRPNHTEEISLSSKLTLL